MEVLQLSLQQNMTRTGPHEMKNRGTSTMGKKCSAVTKKRKSNNCSGSQVYQYKRSFLGTFTCGSFISDEDIPTQMKILISKQSKESTNKIQVRSYLEY